jgi:hypothetical protein
MATRNLVPRGNNEGSLGIDGQRWSALHVASISTDTLKVTNIQLKANDNLSLFTKGAGIEDISTNGSGQFVIAMDDTFLSSLGFNADGSKPDFSANGTVLAGDSFIVAINKLDTAVSNVADPTSLDTTNFTNGVIDTDISDVSGADDTLASAKAIKTYVDAQITLQDLDFQGDNGGALAVDLDSQVLTIAGGTGLTSTGAGQTLTMALDDTAVTPGSYGSATAIPTFTVDQQGRLTAASSVGITTVLTVDADGAGSQNVSLSADDLQILGGTGLTSSISRPDVDGNPGTDVIVSIALDDTSVTAGSYGSTTAIPTFTVDDQGRLTAAGTTNVAIPSTQVTDFEEAVQDTVDAQFDNGTHTGISVTYTDDGGGSDGALSLAIINSGVTAAMLNNDIISGKSALEAGLASTDEFLISDAGTVKKMDVSVLQTYLQSNLNFTSNTDVDVSKANLSTRLASYDSNDTLNIGDADNDTSVVIRGNLTVKGNTTTVDSTTVSIQNAFVFEGATDDEFETTLTTIDPTADRSITLPDQSGSILVLDSATADNDKNTVVTSTPSELNLLDGSIADTVVDSKAVIYSNAGNVRATSFTGPLIGDVTGNADTASTLETARAITLGGDLGGTANFNGSSDITINATIQAGSVENTMLAIDGWSLSLNGAAQEDINLGDTLDFNGTASQVTIAYDAANQDLTFSLPATIDVDTSGNAATAAAWENARTLTLGGDLTGNVSINGSQDVTLNATVADGSIENSMLADDAVGAAELASDAVVNASIAANAAIDLDKLDWTSESAVLTDFAQDDKLFIYDKDVTTIKSMTLSSLEDAVFGNISGDATIAAGGALTIANNSVENGMLAGSIANDKLSNSSINFGGISLALGGSDTTPAFNLSDATNYPTTSLVGTITNEQLAGTISDDKLSQLTTANKVSVSAIDLDGATASGALVAADLILVDDGANGTNRKSTLTQLVSFLQDNTSLTSLSSLSGVGTITSGVWNGTAIADANVANDLTISGGSVDSSIIGANAPAAGTFTTLTANTSLTIGGTTTVTQILDEDNMASDSATSLATQQSIKKYVDDQITAQDLDFTTSSGAGAVDLDSQTLALTVEANKLIITHEDQTVKFDVGSDIVQLTEAQTLTQKTLTSPIVSGLSLSDSSIVFEGATSDDFETTLSVEDPTADRTVTIPNATDTLVGRATTDTLTSKSIDADNNTITNLEVDNLKAGVLDTDLSAVSANDDTVASAKAIKTYVDDQLGRFGGIFLTDKANDNGKEIVTTRSQALGIDFDYTRDVIFEAAPLVRSHFGPFAYSLKDLRDSSGDQGSDIVFFGATSTGASDRHFLVIGSGADKGDTKFTGAHEETP